MEEEEEKKKRILDLQPRKQVTMMKMLLEHSVDLISSHPLQ
jgi:hypothetical protein